jgi:hypothetical protein
MLALSGAQRGTESGRELQETTLSIRQRALAGCREMLQSPTLPSSQEAQIQTLNSMKDEERLTLLASCILLLLYEKISGEGKTNWMPHLDFIHEIWSSHNNGSKSSSSLIDAFIFLRNLYLYNDLVRSTSLRVPTQSNFYLQCGEVEKGRYYYPHLISRLSRHDSTVTDADILRWDGCMNWLPSFALNRHGNSNSTAGEANDEWIISVLYRTTALIYRRQMSFESQVFDFPQTAELAEQAVESMECLPEGSPFENTLLWPIGIVAKSLGMERVSARATILRRLDSLNRRFQMKHFMRAQEILINHWQNMDNNWQHGIATPFGMGLELQADTILLG